MITDAFQDAMFEVARGKRATDEINMTMGLFSTLRKACLEGIVSQDEALIAKRDRLICTVQVLDTIVDQLKQIETLGESAQSILAALMETND